MRSDINALYNASIKDDHRKGFVPFALPEVSDSPAGVSVRYALEIASHGYDIPYEADGRRVVKVGVKFDADTRTPEEWVIAE